MTPEQARAWIRVIRDGILILAGSSIIGVSLILYVTRDEPPNVTWLGLAGVFFGLGAALRADEWLLRDRNGSGNGRRS